MICFLFKMQIFRIKTYRKNKNHVFKTLYRNKSALFKGRPPKHRKNKKKQKKTKKTCFQNSLRLHCLKGDPPKHRKNQKNKKNKKNMFSKLFTGISLHCLKGDPQNIEKTKKNKKKQKKHVFKTLYVCTV